jgi:hypothetical protein
MENHSLCLEIVIDNTGAFAKADELKQWKEAIKNFLGQSAYADKIQKVTFKIIRQNEAVLKIILVNDNKTTAFIFSPVFLSLPLNDRDIDYIDCNITAALTDYEIINNTEFN